MTPRKSHHSYCSLLWNNIFTPIWVFSRLRKLFLSINRPRTLSFWWQPMNRVNTKRVRTRLVMTAAVATGSSQLRTKTSKFLPARCRDRQPCKSDGHGAARSGTGRYRQASISRLPLRRNRPDNPTHANTERFPRRQTWTHFSWENGRDAGKV